MKTKRMPSNGLFIDNNLCLLPASVDFISALFELIIQEQAHLGEWLDWATEIKNYADVRKLVFEEIRKNESGEQAIFYILYKGVLIGSVGLTKIDVEQKEGELGYWLSQKMTRKGFMKKSVKRLVNYAFEELELNSLKIRTVSENIKSSQVALRAGFFLEEKMANTFFFKNKPFNFDIYRLLRKE